MHRIATGLKVGLVLALLYAAARGSAAAWVPLEQATAWGRFDDTVADAGGSEWVREPPVVWAAARGARLLDMPSHRILDRTVGAAWAVNHPRVAPLAVVAIPVVVLSLLGFLIGLTIPRPAPVTEPGVDEPTAMALAQWEARYGRTLAVVAFALAVVGTAAYGFVTGFVAVVVAFRARRHLAKGVSGRFLTALTVLIGALEALAWLAALVSEYHPRAL